MDPRIAKELGAIFAGVSAADHARLLLGGVSLVFIVHSSRRAIVVRLEDWADPDQDRDLGEFPTGDVAVWRVAVRAVRILQAMHDVYASFRNADGIRPPYGRSL